MLCLLPLYVIVVVVVAHNNKGTFLDESLFYEILLQKINVYIAILDAAAA